uniref:ATP-dependent RNA helicase n=1 Tax=Babesia bovis TaxID=5865 RepID=A7ASJ1_BABBO|eukprot:XP_001611078.1 helicase [Babesia bovis T2Bo]
MWWMKGYVKSSGDHIIKYNEDDPIDGAVGSALGRVALVVGGSKTGKTTSYMLALSDIVNQERHDLEKFGPIRDEYRNKLILKKSISTTHYHSRTDMPKIHGIPKFDWNALIVPLGVVLVPHREIAQELFELSCKMQLRTRLLAGGMGNKKAASFRGGYATVTNDKQYDNIDLIISTPEMLVRVLNGAYNDTRIDIKYLQFLIMEEADLLCDGFYLEQMNEVLNMIHSYKLRTICITTAKTDALMNYLQHSHLDGKGDMLSQIQITHPKSHSVGQNVKQIFTAIAQGDPVDRLIETFDELDVRVGSGGPKTLVFCNTVKCCKFLEHTLSDRGYKVVSLHGEMGYGQRTKAIKDYGTRNNILVATNFASRGILNKEVDNVVSFDFPDNVAEYLHRASRVSTNGKKE